ncbi:MAG: Fis family transcriptional regulator [Azoarcus sp.]|jgi:Fis family transcriptional regulator|nr:Fis family transcriptional regulator [Azoarcus sp.]
MNVCHDGGIADAIARTLEQYFRDLDGEKPAAIYNMVIKCAERPMLQFVLDRANGNQSVAAQLLGINRNTLRRKLLDHDLL